MEDGVSVQVDAVAAVDGNEEGDDFLLLADDEIKALKVDGLRKELEKGWTLYGQKAELVKMIQKAMVDRIYIVATYTNEAASVKVFGTGTT